MIEFGGTIYYIDINALEKIIAPRGVSPTDKIISKETKTTLNSAGEIISVEHYESINDRGKEIDGSKYDVIRLCLEVLMDYDEDVDASLGADRALEKTPLNYMMAFNTLYNFGILTEKE
jgi:hypothetical protein